MGLSGQGRVNLAVELWARAASWREPSSSDSLSLMVSCSHFLGFPTKT